MNHEAKQEPVNDEERVSYIPLPLCNRPSVTHLVLIGCKNKTDVYVIVVFVLPTVKELLYSLNSPKICKNSLSSASWAGNSTIGERDQTFNVVQLHFKCLLLLLFCAFCHVFVTRGTRSVPALIGH